jgi:hypothetical protein
LTNPRTLFFWSSDLKIEGTDWHYNWWIGRGGIIIAPRANPDTEIDVDTDGDCVPDLNNVEWHNPFSWE